MAAAGWYRIGAARSDFGPDQTVTLLGSLDLGREAGEHRPGVVVGGIANSLCVDNEEMLPPRWRSMETPLALTLLGALAGAVAGVLVRRGGRRAQIGADTDAGDR